MQACTSVSSFTVFAAKHPLLLGYKCVFPSLSQQCPILLDSITPYHVSDFVNSKLKEIKIILFVY